MFCTLLFTINLIIAARTYDHSIPRGVAIGKASLYNSLSEFTCFDGSLTLPFSYVNDDYCDCFDGSDEPGTSACPNGVFHCINNGYVSVNIPTSRVNDGICDCCDASDEYGTGNCTDTCAILGAEAKKQAEKMAELVLKGNQLMLELSAAGKQIKKENKERIAALETEKAEAERLRMEVEKVKAAAETSESAALEVYKALEEAERVEQAEKEKKEAEEEALEAFMHLDSNSDNKLEAEEIRVRQTFDQNKDGAVSDDELKFFMDSKTEITWEEFKESTWPRIKPFYMLEKGMFTPPENSEHLEEEEDEEEQDNEENEKNDDEKHEEVNEEDWEKVSDGDEEEKDHNKEDKPESSGTKYDEQTQKLIEEANKARSQYETAERAVQDLERELSQLKDSISKDYGVDDEFAPLDGQCFTYTDREYTYKLCPFDQVVQMAKSGGSETRLGLWKSWGSEGDYNVMLYDKGQSCWNGPQRSTKVLVSCGLESAVIGAAEPNKCEYVLDFKTPAACRIVEESEDIHDEL